MILVLIGVCFVVNAQDASGDCKLPGTYDYVSVDFYKGESNKQGQLTYSVQTNEFAYLNEVKVVVKATILIKLGKKDSNGNLTEEPVWEEVTLFNDKLRDIPVNKTNYKNVQMPSYYKIKNICIFLFIYIISLNYKRNVYNIFK